MRQIDLILWFIWQGLSSWHGSLSVWMGRMALAHYASAKTEKFFSIRRLDESIYIIGATDLHGEPYCTPLFHTGEPAQAKAQFESTTRDSIFFLMDLHEFRKIAAESLAKGDVEHV